MPTGKLHKKEKPKKLEYFHAGYVGNLYRNFADNVNKFLGAEFYGRIANDANLLSEDVQNYILATSDFAKGIQNDINHYVTRDRINDASYRQKLDPISKNILRRQNPLELVFEDVSTFDAENPFVGSLITELNLKKESINGDFIKSLSGVRGQEFEIQKRLDRLRDLKIPNRKSNKNINNNVNGGGNLFPPGPGSGGGLFPPGPGNLPFPPQVPQPPPPRIPDEYEL